MNWAKEAAQAIVDDDALLQEADEKRRRRNAMLTLGALAGGVGLAGLTYANRGAISDAFNKAVTPAPAPPQGIVDSITNHISPSGVLAGAGAGAVLAGSKAVANTRGIGTALNKLRSLTGAPQISGLPGALDATKNLEKPAPTLLGRNDSNASMRQYLSNAEGHPDPQKVQGVQELLTKAINNSPDSHLLNLDPARRPAGGQSTADLPAIPGAPVATSASPTSTSLWRRPFSNSQASTGRDIAARLQASDIDPVIAKQIAAVLKPGADAGTRSVAANRSIAGDLGRVLEGQNKAPASGVSLPRVLAGAATGAALPYLLNVGKGALGIKE